jgi:hypothetical protein
VTCSHPAGAITDHTIQDVEGSEIRYAWRGACLSCQRGVVGTTALPPGLSTERLNDRLTGELMSYFSRVAALSV